MLCVRRTGPSWPNAPAPQMSGVSDSEVLDQKDQGVSTDSLQLPTNDLALLVNLWKCTFVCKVLRNNEISKLHVIMGLPGVPVQFQPTLKQTLPAMRSQRMPVHEMGQGFSF